MSLRRFLSLGLAALISTNCIAASDPFVCPTASAIQQTHYVGTFESAFFVYTGAQNNFVVVFIPLTKDNPTPTEAQAHALLNATTIPYPNSIGAPCFYAPYANQVSTSSFVMWDNQLPPEIMAH